MLNQGEIYPFDIIYHIIMLLITMVSSIYMFQVKNFRMEKDKRCFELGNEKREKETCRGRMGGFRVSVRRGIKCSVSGVIS